ncbi:MAG: hypothetical protein RMJ56_01935 [Gemmataceae bacterium]|nr:hypothetical protein [Gemmata sp.]MDW8196344.1 hypothetical protein [Gemmataceae bacterium]
MSRTLSLVETAWDVIQALVARQQYRAAFRQLSRLLARPDVPATLAEKAHRLAGQLAFELEHYAAARRHWKAVWYADRECAEAAYALGRAWEDDPDGCDRRAAKYFRHAFMRQPDNPLYRATFGRSMARCGRIRQGIRHMLAASQSAENDHAVIRVVVTGLLEIGQIGEARRIVAKARFLAPGCAVLAGLWQRVQFEQARVTQRRRGDLPAHLRSSRLAQEVRTATEGVRTIVPVLHVVRNQPLCERGGWRRDEASYPRPHLASLKIRQADG